MIAALEQKIALVGAAAEHSGQSSTKGGKARQPTTVPGLAMITVACFYVTRSSRRGVSAGRPKEAQTIDLEAGESHDAAVNRKQRHGIEPRIGQGRLGCLRAHRHRLAKPSRRLPHNCATRDLRSPKWWAPQLPVRLMSLGA